MHRLYRTHERALIDGLSGFTEWLAFIRIHINLTEVNPQAITPGPRLALIATAHEKVVSIVMQLRVIKKFFE